MMEEHHQNHKLDMYIYIDKFPQGNSFAFFPPDLNQHSSVILFLMKNNN